MKTLQFKLKLVVHYNIIVGHIVFNTAIGFSKGFGIFSFVFLVLYLLVAILQVITFNLVQSIFKIC